MSRRERFLAGFLGIALVGGVVYASWAVVISPWFANRARAKVLAAEIADQESKADDLRFVNRRLETEVYPRSLPPNVELAKQEYEKSLRRILRDAKLPNGYQLNEIPAEQLKTTQAAKGPGGAAAKSPVTKIGYRVNAAKTDYGSAMNFLRRFYEMNLLHQITKFSLKREGDANLKDDIRQANQRTDLVLGIDIEALIVEGVPARRTLYVPSVVNAAVLGSSGFAVLQNEPDVARGLVPREIVRVLAEPSRNYADVVAHDVFHGLLPAPIVVPPPGPVITPTIPILPNLARYVKYTNTVQTSDGHTLVELHDISVDAYYLLDVHVVGDRQTVHVQKFAITGEGRVLDKDYPPQNWLTINNRGSSGNRKFWVYGLDGDSLILGDRDGPPAAAAPAKSGTTNKGSKTPTTPAKTVPVTTPADPKTAVLGGIAAAGPKPERFYRWDFGGSMDKIKELAKPEADPILARWGVVATAQPPLTPTKPAGNPFDKPKAAVAVEVAPVPREAKEEVEPEKE